MSKEECFDFGRFVSKRITELRMARNLSEQKMSYELGKNKNYISTISKGKANPSLEALVEICEYFGLTPSEFFDPDLKSPALWNQAKRSLEKLSEEDLKIVLMICERFQKE